MQYIALIYTAETGAPEPAMMQAYGKYNEEMGAKGLALGKRSRPFYTGVL